MSDLIKRRRLSKIERQRVYEKYQGHCAYCGEKIEIKNMQVDHIIPIRLGGVDDIENMLPSCRICNHYRSCVPFAY